MCFLGIPGRGMERIDIGPESSHTLASVHGSLSITRTSYEEGTAVVNCRATILNVE